MKKIIKIFFAVASVLITTHALANLAYNPEHDEALKSLKAVESASINMQYNCGKYSLIISAYATESEVNGRKATVTGKIVSEKASHDISESLTKAISRRNILTGQISVACNAGQGAFELEFTPNAYAPKSVEGKSLINVFSDGTVEGGTQIWLEGYPKK